MLKQRIIPKFLISGSRLVKFVGFHGNLREAGNPVSTARVYDAYGADELMFLDIDATPSGRPVSGSVIERVSVQVSPSGEVACTQSPARRPARSATLAATGAPSTAFGSSMPIQWAAA